MITNYAKAINEILRFTKIFKKIDSKSRTPQKLIGDLGEYYVLRELTRRGLFPQHKSGQGSYDILLQNSGKKVEVKTSLPKNEGVYPKGILFWGWTVERKGKGRRSRKQKYDYLVGVALTKNLQNPKFYVFSSKETMKIGNVNIGRFGSIKKKINLFVDRRTFKKALRSSPSLVTRYERKINSFPRLFKDKWKKMVR